MYRIKNVRNATVAKEKDLSPAFSKPLQKPPSRQIIFRNLQHQRNIKESKNTGSQNIQVKLRDAYNKPIQQKNPVIIRKNNGSNVKQATNQIRKVTNPPAKATDSHIKVTNPIRKIANPIGKIVDQTSKQLIERKLKIVDRNQPIKIGNKARIIDRKVLPLIKVTQKIDGRKPQVKQDTSSIKQIPNLGKQQQKQSKIRNIDSLSQQVCQIRQQGFNKFVEDQIRLKEEQQERNNNEKIKRQRQLQIQKQRQQQIIKQKRRKERQEQLQLQKQKQRQLQEQIRIIQERREKRQRQKEHSRKRQQQRKQIQRQIQRQVQMGNEDALGMIHLPEQLAHFQMQDLIMDAQVNKILKTSFNHFPNGQAIQAQKEQLQRINMSYTMVKEDPNNSLINGLKNFRTEIFNRIGILIMEAQSQGYRNQNFAIIQGDSRIPLPLKNVSITKGLNKKFIQQIATKIIMQDDEQCSICLNTIRKGQTGRTLKCKHGFHPECIDSWLQNNANCPSCRFNVKFGNRQ